MTSTHIERYIELSAQIVRLKKRIGSEVDPQTQGQLLVEMNDAVRERNDLWDAIEFRVPEIT